MWVLKSGSRHFLARFGRDETKEQDLRLSARGRRSLVMPSTLHDDRYLRSS